MDAREKDLLFKMLDERHQNLVDTLEKNSSAVMVELGKINAGLERLDGRQRAVENQVSVLKWAYGVGAAVVGLFFTQKGG